jgi:hypothetical protein
MNGTDRNGGSHRLIIALGGATIIDLKRISIALNHLTDVVAGLIAATPKLLAQTKIIEVAGTRPATTWDLGSTSVGQAT